MTRSAKTLLAGCGALSVVAIAVIVFGVWWFLRGSPVVDRLELVGPETQAFVTFLAVPEDRALVEVIQSLKQRSVSKRGDKRAEWLSALNDLISGARIYHVRASAMVESLPGGQSEVGIVVSLGKMSNLVRMLLGLADSEREVETYHKERIILGRDKQDFAMSFAGNNLILSRDVRTVELLIDRIKNVVAAGKPSDKMEAVLKDIDPRREMPGCGGLVNDPASGTSLGGIWRLVTDAPEGSEIALPPTFGGAGFRFGFVSADAVSGDGYFYFQDEEAAAGASDELESAILRMFGHYHLKPKVDIQQEGSRLHVSVEATGLQSALDQYFPKTR